MSNVVPSPAAAPEPLPASFGPFLVRGVVGRGGMGVVYRAEHRDTGEAVAVKSVSLARRTSLAGIRSEIGALGRLAHPGIVSIRGHGIEAGVPWYAMELLEGGTLSTFIRDLWPARSAVDATTTTVSPSAPFVPLGVASFAAANRVGFGPKPAAAAGRLTEVARVFRQIAEALAYLHGRGVVHRDIKPSNVFVREDGTPVLVDFGLIWRARGSVGREALELGGRLVGTFAYLSPEQINREAIDGRTDLYALGCVLYETVTGVVPFAGPGGDHIMRQHLTELPTPPSQLVRGLDERFDRLILSLLAKKRRERIGHAEDVVRILTSIIGGPAPVVAETQAYLYRPELAGRDDILGEIESGLDRLARKEGSFVCFAGESGIGKTFLAGEASKRAIMRNLRVIGGECVPLAPQTGSATIVEHRGLPLQPFRPLLDAVADYCREHGAARTERVLGARAKVIAEQVPEFAELPGVSAHAAPPDLPPDEAHRRLIDDLRETLAVFASEDRPLLIVLDDLQWADELSLRLLLAMPREWLRDNGVMILGTYRSDEVGPDLCALIASPGIRALPIERMNAKFVGQIACDMLGVQAVPQTVIDFLWEHSEGVPFFVAEYLRTAVSEGLLLREGGQWILRGGAISEAELRALPLPRSIHDMMMRRLTGLGEELRSLAEVASVLGREIDLERDLEILTSVAELSDSTTTERARELVRQQIFEAPEVGRYRFVHDKLREMAYGALPPARREGLHRAIARLRERQLLDHKAPVPYGELGHHFMQGQLWDKAIDYLEKAGDQAAARFANREAIGFLDTATSLTGKLSFGLDRARLARWQRQLVDSHLGLGQMTEAYTHAERALRLCGFKLPSSKAGWVIGLVGQILLRIVQRFGGHAFRARLARTEALTYDAAYVLNRLCEPFFLSQKPLQGFYCGIRDLNLAERIPPSEALARGYATMAMVVGIGPFVKLGRTWSDRAISIARALHTENALIYCLSRSGSLLMTVPEWELATTRVEEADAKARARSDLRQLGENATTLGLLTAFRGRFEESLAAARETIRIGVFRGDHQLRQWGQNQAVHALARLGRSGEAVPLVRALAEYHRTRQVGEAEKIFDIGGFAMTHLRLGELDEANRKAVQALDMMRKEAFLPYFLKGGLEGVCDVFVTLLERADRRARDYGRLAANAGQAVKLLKKFAGFYAVARPRAAAMDAHVLWLRGKREAALRAWKKALKLAEVQQMPYEIARIHLELGARAASAAAPTDARRAHLEAARQLFVTLGTTPDLERADAALAGIK
jgi:serine/threonine protein kinase/tetratricopeptide (TPR) repeat protein